MLAISFHIVLILVEGKYAPLFQEDENAWIVEKIMTFSDFFSFVEMITVYQKNRNGNYK
jgi:hypothetical protein